MSTTQLVGDMEIMVPMAGLVDKDAEIARLSKEIEELAKEVKRFEGKLNNERFISKAPADVVQKEQAKLEAARSSKTTLEQQLTAMEAL